MSLGSVLVNTATPTLVAGDLPIGTSLLNTSPNATIWVGNSSAVATGNGMPVTAGATIQSNVTGPIWAILDNSAGDGSTATLVYSTVATVLTSPAIVAPGDNWSYSTSIPTLLPASFNLNHDSSTYTYGPVSVIASASCFNWTDGSVNYTFTFTLNVPSLGIFIPLGAPAVSTHGTVNPPTNGSAMTTIGSLPKAPYTITVVPNSTTETNFGTWNFACYLSP